MKRFLTAVVFCAMLSLHAAAPLRGADRLRELVVFPEINLHFSLAINFSGNQWVINDNGNRPEEISQLRQKLKPHPDDIKLLLHLGNLLDDDDETNESKTVYLRVEKLCRNKIALNPQDGLTMLDLGEALHELNHDEEAGHFYHQATLVSSNEWKCWVGLGNFLSYQFYSMFPNDLRHQMWSSPQKVLNYRPPPEALKKSEDSLADAAICFDRALSLAPKDSAFYFQRAGFVSESNYQNYFFQQVRGQETVDASLWEESFFSKETVTNLQKAAELDPKNYEYAGLAAYFGIFNAVIESKSPNHSFTNLPSAMQQSIHQDLNPLEKLTRDPDKKTAAGAWEDLGALNSMMGNGQTAIADLRQAVASDPTREESWDLLLGSLKDTAASPEDLEAVCQDRLKVQNNALNHLLLGKLYVQSRQWNKAAEQAKVALQQETNNVISEMMLAAIALKESKPGDDLSVADAHLQRTSDLIKAMPTGFERSIHWRELVLDIAIDCALRGEPETAKMYLKEIVKYYPNDQTVKDIANALN